ncbi:MAG: glycosyltransferase [Deinococcales bacterium]
MSARAAGQPMNEPAAGRSPTMHAAGRPLTMHAAGRPDVALFLPSLDAGGAERVMLDLADAFLELGVAAELVLASRRGPYLEDVPSELPVVDLGRSRVATSLLPLGAYLRRRRPRALLSTLEHANVAALAVRRVAPGIRAVIREANTVSRDLASGEVRSRVLLRLMRWTYPTADAVVAVSAGVARDLSERLHVPAGRLHVIENPVLTPRLRAGAREPLDHPWFGAGEPPVVLAAGRLTPQKGFATLLRAFARARSRRPCRLVVLGEGEQRAELEALATELAVAEAVSLPGFVPNPFPHMARAGAFVLSSAWEGLPNVLIQALALGAPVVATDCRSGPAEILDGGARGNLGALVPVGDEVAMAEAILGALERGRAAPPQSWLERYDRDAVAKRYLEVLGVDG